MRTKAIFATALPLSLLIGAMAFAQMEPAVKTAIAAMKTVRAPYLSATQPLMGMNTARLRR